MKKNVHYFKIGVFVLLMLTLLIGGLIVLGAESWWEEMIPFETYLDESVQGLDIGSPVLQRGVKIGRIKNITFVPHAYPDIVKPGTPEFEKFGTRILIVMEIDRKHFPSDMQDSEKLDRNLKTLIDSGYRIKLSYQGITGLAFLEGDFVDPIRNPPEFPSWQTHYTYIPSTPSLITSFTEAIDNVFQRLNTIDFEAIFEQFENTLASIQKAVDEVQMEELNQSVLVMVDDIRSTSSELRGFIQQVEDPNIPQQIAATLTRFNRTLSQMETVIAGNRYDINTMIENLKDMSEFLRDFAQAIKRDPAQLLLSSPPARTEVYKNENK